MYTVVNLDRTRMRFKMYWTFSSRGSQCGKQTAAYINMWRIQLRVYVTKIEGWPTGMKYFGPKKKRMFANGWVKNSCHTEVMNCARPKSPCASGSPDSRASSALAQSAIVVRTMRHTHSLPDSAWALSMGFVLMWWKNLASCCSNQSHVYTGT